jgi:DNA-binding transcriptional regulator YiaG
MDKRYKSEIMMVLHQDAEGLFQVGAISEERMRRYDHACLVQDEPAMPKARKPRPACAKRAALAD